MHAVVFHILEYCAIGSTVFEVRVFCVIDECYRKGLVRIFKLLEAPLSDSRRRRSRSSIIANILDVAKRGVVKTRIMYRASLSFVQLNEYLSFLLDMNLLETVENPNRTLYKTTNKGLQYLQSYMEIEELFKKEKGENPRL